MSKKKSASAETQFQSIEYESDELHNGMHISIYHGDEKQNEDITDEEYASINEAIDSDDECSSTGDYYDYLFDRLQFTKIKSDEKTQNENKQEKVKDMSQLNSPSRNTDATKKNKPSVYALAETFKASYPILNYKDYLYIYIKEKGYYQKKEERYVTTKLKTLLDRKTLDSVSVREYKDVYEQLLTDDDIVINDDGREDNIVLFRNGAYNILDGFRVQGAPEKFFTCMINANYKYGKNRTPVFDDFLETATRGNKQVKNLILAFIGYCLIPNMEGKCFFVLGTAPDSGKSVLGRLLKRLLSEDSVSNVPLENFGKTFSLAPIVGKQLNLAMDLKGGALNDRDVSYIKQLTGEDDVSIEIKYINPFSHSNTAKFVFATNKPIRLKEDDEAFWRRMILIPFIYSIPKEYQNTNLLEDLWAERDGIVSRAIDAVKPVIDNHYEFPKCKLSEYIKTQWRWYEIADVLNFVRECCDLTDLSVRATVSELYKAYCDYCNENDLYEKDVKGFSQVLKNHFNLKPFKGEYNSHNLRGYKGIKLKSQGGDYND